MTDLPAQRDPRIGVPVSLTPGLDWELLRAESLQAPPRPGLLGSIDRFEVLSVLGQGAMGVVLLARDPVADTRVAIKILRPELTHDPRMIGRFLTEARHMLRLRHEHILPVYEVSERPTGPYYVMPYKQRGSLGALIQPRQPLETGTVLTVAADLAAALVYAHAQGVIHRDVKPHNVLLDPDGRACLADFGLVWAFDRNESTTEPGGGGRLGTVAYMSPAVARGEAEDTRCDIYSFGAVLYEMLTGEPPYTGNSPEAVIAQILAGPPASVRSRNPQADASLAAVAEACLARELRDRYATMTDALADLDRIRTSQKPLGPHGRDARRSANRVAYFAAGIILAVLSVVGWRTWRPESQPQPASHSAPADLGRGAIDSQPVNRRPRPAGGPRQRQPATRAMGSSSLSLDLGDGLELEFVEIPAGHFIMGSTQGTADEKVHHVIVTKPFYLGKYEITFRQFAQFVAETSYRTDAEKQGFSLRYVGSRASGDARTCKRIPGMYWRAPIDYQPTDRHPAACLSWSDATAFCKWLSRLLGRLCRLPTEAEWEYACRAGGTTFHFWGNEVTGFRVCGNVLDRCYGEKNRDWLMATEWSDGYAFAAPVGSFRPNGWGLHDMLGNVAEYCADWYAPYGTADQVDPTGPTSLTGRRVARGGSWTSPPHLARVYNRLAGAPRDAFAHGGFRVAMDATSQNPASQPALGAAAPAPATPRGMPLSPATTRASPR
ncbi:MAG TPA: bifunctional serine/threonine-protein kinase/formylglycine-generating enzyme family protein [Phycisphaerae bacterium]|nr:bifunctional serine/threonine-protein kinase/formylglycine-generating enzyme family protein [Phycisphaerae bacterium]HRY70759.1 bifunctional serine/threonine-protein kinase/formylglycine-generating enzyme family protein [Phycisphaerae bacterium]HSA28875.1 bifunctional serine/threonine-protein kinase/formylglycine-generating enzyme family protein [Phycisphaerae bacterium]